MITKVNRNAHIQRDGSDNDISEMI